MMLYIIIHKFRKASHLIKKWADASSFEKLPSCFIMPSKLPRQIDVETNTEPSS